jgi:ribosomal peptide maturation radical SAM protein 1
LTTSLHLIGIDSRPEQDPEDAPARSLRVALVNMPWARTDAPSIQCGLLQAIARAEGHSAKTYYLNLDLAQALGREVYDALSGVQSERLHLLGEWLFGYAAFGEVTDENDYYADFPEIEPVWRRLTGQGLTGLTEIRRKLIPEWLEKCVDTIPWESYDVVGFSSTFLQNTASLALGRLLKQRYPELCTVYGGANFDGDMGVEFAKRLSWLDYVVTGEGDVAFPRLLREIAADTRRPIAGVFGNSAGLHPDGAAPVRVQTLDRLPFPNYADYFEALGAYGTQAILGRDPVTIPVEFSRGCWWGEKHHCTFCGLNALGMAYRAKSPSRALAELAHLLTEYPAVHIEAVDNILDMKYISSVCADLAEKHWDVSIFFEVKANLTREQLGVLASVGIMRIQPGIESLSTHVLKIMRKGATGLLNVRLLKWARYYGISVAWNLLTGFPGETDEDYDQQVEVMSLLHHLQPPAGCERIWLERFSPYFTDDSFPIWNVRPRDSYRHIYPDYLDHAEIAYFFDYDVSGIGSEQAYGRLSTAAAEWKRRWKVNKPTLIYRRLPGKLTILDGRTNEPRQAVLHGWHADAYEACGDSAHNAARVAESLAASGHQVSADEVAAFLRRCCRSGVMIAEEGKYLSLALPENRGW